MADIFKDILPSVLQTKDRVITDENERDYVPFVVNRALSFHYDCVMHVNQMNMHPGLDRKLQYDYYLNSLRAYKRPFQRWQKRETVENLDAIKAYYKYSNEKAKDALSVLTDAQIDQIKTRIDKGGLNDKPKRIGRGETK
jgi:hypothetical protein